MALTFVSHLLFPVVVLPAFVPAGIAGLFQYLNWPSVGPTYFLASLALVALAVVLYWTALPRLGRLLQLRERLIMQAVTSETE